MIYLWLTLLVAPLLRRLAGSRTDPPRAVLLVQTAKIGDFVCTTPVIRELRRGWPDAKLHLLINRVNEPLVRENPYDLQVHLLPEGRLRGFAGRLWLWRLLRRERIDTLICVSPSLAAWIVPLWAGVGCRASVLPNFGGSSYQRGVRLLTHSEKHVAGRLVLETEFSLLEKLGLKPQSREKEAWYPPDAFVVADSLLAGCPGPLVGVGISSGNKLKELGEEKLTQLAVGLLSRSAASLILIGGPGDRQLADRVGIRLQSEGYGARVRNLAGMMDLSRLPALLSRLTVYFGVDSGITYLADAMHVPVVDFMGPADADDQRPTGKYAEVLRVDLPCAPCSHAFQAPYTCAVGTTACVRDAAVEILIQAVLRAFDDTRSRDHD